MSRESPQIGAWFKNVEEDHTFEVVAFDEDEELVEVQFDTGEVEELDLDTWHELPLVACAPPNEWDGVFEETELGDEEMRGRKRFAMDEEEEWAEEAEEPVDELEQGDEDES